MREAVKKKSEVLPCPKKNQSQNTQEIFFIQHTRENTGPEKAARAKLRNVTDVEKDVASGVTREHQRTQVLDIEKCGDCEKSHRNSFLDNIRADV